MTENRIQFEKKREAGDIFTDSFKFIKLEYKPISKLVLIYVLPFLIMYGVAQVLLQKNFINKIDFTDQEALLAMIGPVYLNIFLIALFGLFVQSLLIATFYTYIDAYIKKGKGNFELTDITPQLFSNGLLAIGASFVIFIAVFFGLLLCVIPGIYLANTLSLSVFILIFEKKGIGSALLRSAYLVKSQWWNTFLINIVGLIFIWAASIFFSFPLALSGFSVDIFNPSKMAAEFPGWYWVATGVLTVISSVVYIILYTFISFQYFNLIVRSKPTTSTLN